ncbi:MAG: hypothetical protein AAF985_21175 [Bacteroidota bacterium]
MFLNSILECERNSVKKMEKLQLPNSFKKIGIGLALFSLLFLLVNKFTFNSPDFRTAIKYGLLLGMLLISVSKEQIEDELMVKLRMQAYRLAFIFGVFLTLIQPFINYFVDYLFDPSGAVIQDTGNFEILWILLSVQVIYFEVLKRMHK